jgi:hypothetical protein
MNTIVSIYCIYLPLVIALTIWVAGTLHKNAEAFLKEIFSGHEQVAKSVNNLIQTGFYLVSLGYGFLQTKIVWTESSQNMALQEPRRVLVETLAAKIGAFALFEGAVFLFLFLMLLSIRKSAKQALLNEERVKQYWHQQQQYHTQKQQGAGA